MLDSKASLNINIFLKQFRTSNSEIVAIIAEGNAQKISLEQLKAFEKLLPEKSTVSYLHKLVCNFSDNNFISTHKGRYNKILQRRQSSFRDC